MKGYIIDSNSEKIGGENLQIRVMLPEKIPGGAFGMFILAAINQLKDDAYGARIAKLLHEYGRNAPTPRVYQNLSLLEGAGFLTSRIITEDGPRVRGMPAKVYSLTDSAKSIFRFFHADTD